MKTKTRLVWIIVFALFAVVIGISALSYISTPADGSLFRAGLLTVDDVKDSVKDDEYEKVENKTSLIKEYIRVLLNNLF